jgi:hypothetical protein
MFSSNNRWSVLKDDDNGKMTAVEAIVNLKSQSRPRPSIATLLKNWKENMIHINTWCHFCMKGMKGKKDECETCSRQHGLEQVEDLRSHMLGKCAFHYPIGSEYWNRDDWDDYFDDIDYQCSILEM